MVSTMCVVICKSKSDITFQWVLQNIEVEEDQADDRSVDDLLLFINGGNEGIFCSTFNFPSLGNCATSF